MTEGQLSEILTSLPTRISDVVKPWAERSPDRPALVEDTRSWTYGQLDSVVAETLAWLHDSGVRPGDRVMIVCENCRAFVAVLDRKSTRLNSSHRCTSYAVFCLKKQN